MKIVYKIVYVSPNTVILEFLKKALGSLDCDLIHEKDIGHYLEHRSELNADLVLIDADYDTADFWALPRKADVGTDVVIPSILISSKPAHRQKAADAGFADFILRPFEADELIIKINLALLLGRYREALEETGKFDQLLEAMQDGIVLLDPKLMIERVNGQAREFLSASRGYFLELIRDFRCTYPGHLASDLISEPLVFDLERGETDAVRPLILEVRTNVIKDPFRNVTGVVAALKNVTEIRRKSFQEEVFLNLISHKLKTPLSIVHKNAQLFQKKVLGPLNADQEKFMGAICDKTSELVDSFEKLLGFTMIKSRRWDLPPEQILLGERLQELLDAQIRKAKGRKLKVDVKLEPERIMMNVNPKYFDLIFNNLIENAVKFNDKPQAFIDVSVKAQSDGIELTVKDNGAGIPPEEFEKIFDEFYQVDKHRTLNVAGTGLGLAIVKFLVEMSGGNIEVMSEPGQGSTFRVYLKNR